MAVNTEFTQASSIKQNKTDNDSKRSTYANIINKTNQEDKYSKHSTYASIINKTNQDR
jgi:hypothetical protein